MPLSNHAANVVYVALQKALEPLEGILRYYEFGINKRHRQMVRAGISHIKYAMDVCEEEADKQTKEEKENAVSRREER